MIGYVLDASSTLARAFDDEASPAVEQVLAEMAAGCAVVPVPRERAVRRG